MRKSQIEFRCRLFRGRLGRARLSRQQSLDVPVPRYLIAQPLAQSARTVISTLPCMFSSSEWWAPTFVGEARQKKAQEGALSSITFNIAVARAKPTTTLQSSQSWLTAAALRSSSALGIGTQLHGIRGTHGCCRRQISSRQFARPMVMKGFVAHHRVE